MSLLDEIVRDGARAMLAAALQAEAACPSQHSPERGPRRPRCNAEDKDHVVGAAKAFEDLCGEAFRKAVAKTTDDLDVLLGFYDSPVEHWVHLRTTNPIWVSCLPTWWGVASLSRVEIGRP